MQFTFEIKLYQKCIEKVDKHFVYIIYFIIIIQCFDMFIAAQTLSSLAEGKVIIGSFLLLELAADCCNSAVES